MDRANNAGLRNRSEPRSTLPFEAHVAPWEGGWTVLLPVRAEACTIEKQTVVYEQVMIRIGEVTNVQHITAPLLRETLTVEAEGLADRDRPTVGAWRPEQSDPARTWT